MPKGDSSASQNQNTGGQQQQPRWSEAPMYRNWGNQQQGNWQYGGGNQQYGRQGWNPYMGGMKGGMSPQQGWWQNQRWNQPPPFFGGGMQYPQQQPNQQFPTQFPTNPWTIDLPNNPQFNNWQQNMNSVLGRMGQAGQNMQNRINPILSQLRQAQQQGNTGINPTNSWWNNAHTMDLPTSSMYSNAGDIANRGGNPNDPSQWQGWQGKTPLWQQQGGFTGMMNPGMTGGFLGPMQGGLMDQNGNPVNQQGGVGPQDIQSLMQRMGLQIPQARYNV